MMLMIVQSEGMQQDGNLSPISSCCLLYLLYASLSYFSTLLSSLTLHLALQLFFSLIVTLIVASVCWLEQVKHNNGGQVQHGGKETWELFSDYQPVFVCLWLLLQAMVKLSLSPATWALIKKFVEVSKDD
jgi:hypothetical protein